MGNGRNEKQFTEKKKKKRAKSPIRETRAPDAPMGKYQQRGAKKKKRGKEKKIFFFWEEKKMVLRAGPKRVNPQDKEGGGKLRRKKKKINKNKKGQKETDADFYLGPNLLTHRKPHLQRDR